jgi:ADP-ribose pyrophosphatase YjhB (NUDIX family)
LVDLADPSKPLIPRDTGRGIVIHDGKILLMERWRPNLHYFSIPGGGIEAGETAEQTAVREIMEETTIEVEVERLVMVMQDGITHKVFLCRYLSGEPELAKDSPEALHMNDYNRFKPRWIDLDEVPGLAFIYWEPLKQHLVDGIRDGFPEAPVTVTIAG